MDNFFGSFSTTSTNLSFTTTPPNSSNTSNPQQNMGLPQDVVYFPHNSGKFIFPATPYPTLPYDHNLHPSPYMKTTPQMIYLPHDYPHPPLYSFPTGKSSVPFSISVSKFQVQGNLPQPMEGDKKAMEATRHRNARDKRKQRMQRSRCSIASGSPSVPKESIREQPVVDVKETAKQYTKYKTAHVFHTSDGKRLEEILTKRLQNSDIGNLGRIVLPKVEIEEKFPALNKEGIEVVLKDICTSQEWKVKLKYWLNQRSRMYLLENTRDLVNYYNLEKGDSITLYEDQLQNMYVLPNKEHNQKAETSMALKSKDLGNKSEDEDANNYFTSFSGRDSSRGRECNNIAQHELLNNNTKEVSNQVFGQATKEIATTPFNDQTTSTDDEQQSSLDKVYESLDNILEVNWGN